MSCARPDTMRAYLAERVATGNYGNTSEYIRDLVRRDQEERAKKRLRELIEDGLVSGSGVASSKTDAEHLLALARGGVD